MNRHPSRVSTGTALPAPPERSVFPARPCAGGVVSGPPAGPHRSPGLVLLGAVALLAGLGGRATAGEIRMTLAQCLDRAMSSALEIREGRHLPAIAGTRVAEAEAEFDHLFSFRASGGFKEVQSGSFLGGADVLREQTASGETGISAKLRSGGTYGISFSSGDLITNSRFLNFRPQWSNALALNFTQPLLRNAWRTVNEARIRIAEAGVRGDRARFRGVLDSTLAAVERAYWNLVFLRDDLQVKKKSLEVAEELLRISRKRREAGAGTNLEVVQAEAGVARREKDLILAEHLLKDGEDLLVAFLFPFAENAGQEITIVPTSPVAAPLNGTDEDLAARLRKSFERRPDVIAAREDLKAAGIRVVQKESDLLPRLDLFGSIALTGLADTITDAGRPILRTEHTGWEVGLTLEIPIGNRAARAAHRRALLERSRIAVQFESLKNRVVVQVRSALRAVATARREVLATRKASAAAQAQFAAEKERLKADKSTNYHLLQVEDDLSLARSQERLALVAYRNALVDLEEATGTFLASRGIRPLESRLPDGGSGGSRPPPPPGER